MAQVGLKMHAENVTALLISGVWPGHDFDDTRRWLTEQSAGRRRAWIFGVIGLLAALAGVAAAFGPEGLAVYFLAMVFLAR